MSDRSGPVTHDHVETAVKELKAANKRPSWRAVRAHLGKGSPNTILAHLRTLERHNQDHAASIEVPPPAAITEMVGIKVWQAALAAARAQVADDRLALEGQLAVEVARADELATAIERLEEQLSEARRQSEAQVAVLERLTSTAERIEHQAAAGQTQSAEQSQRLFQAVTVIAAAQADHRTATAALSAQTAQMAVAVERSATVTAEATSALAANVTTPLASLDIAIQALAADQQRLSADLGVAIESATGRLVTSLATAAQHHALQQRTVVARLDRWAAGRAYRTFRPNC